MFKRCLILLCLSLFSQVTLAAIVAGNPQGAVTLTEVMDYQCGHCHRMQPLINWLMVHDKHLKIRLIPVAIINKNSLVEATSSYVMAKNTNDFLKYHEFLMSRARRRKRRVYYFESLALRHKDISSQDASTLGIK